MSHEALVFVGSALSGVAERIVNLILLLFIRNRVLIRQPSDSELSHIGLGARGGKQQFGWGHARVRDHHDLQAGESLARSLELTLHGLVDELLHLSE